MQELENILKEIDTHAIEFELFGTSDDYISVGWVKDIIRKNMNDDKCGECSRRKWYQKGYEDGRKDNDGWTPVEERLPEAYVGVEEIIEDDDCLEYIVTVDGASESTVLKYSPGGTWFDENGCTYNVVAWRPLPGSYRPWKGKTDKNIITRIIERINHLCALSSGCGAIFGNTKEKECYYKGRRDAFEQAIEEIQTIYDRQDP